MPAFSNRNGQPSDMSVQNAVMVCPIPQGQGRASVSMKTGVANGGTADFVLEADFGDGDYVSVGMLKPADGTALTSLTGASKAGVVPLNLGACANVRARRTDANGGAAVVLVNIAAD